MPTLNVTEFSCLSEATFDLAQVNVIIGPQGSGKSVTTKLLYFLSDITANFIQAAERGDSLEEYKRSLAKQFSNWFPPSAWGVNRFNISYSAGPFSVRMLRRRVKGKLADDVAITFSEWFVDLYKYALSLFEDNRRPDDNELPLDLPVRDALDRAWRVRDLVVRKLERDLGENYFRSQTFIPAGRAFFTSIGRLVAGFEQAGSLDPVTVRFARLFAALRDRNTRQYLTRINRLSAEFAERRKTFMLSLFGGEVKFDNELEYVDATDGRKIPFSALSSGQQELLPMWSIMDYMAETDTLGLPTSRRGRRAREIVYIEEPEAHLFPSAQSMLMEFLVSSLVPDKSHRSLIITTHSPYIMGKLNVFMKAGQLARRKRRTVEIAEIVPRDCWLDSRQVSALAIDNGELRPIIDEEGLIDADYLDAVSEENARQFSRLLQIESER